MQGNGGDGGDGGGQEEKGKETTRPAGESGVGHVEVRRVGALVPNSNHDVNGFAVIGSMRSNGF
jgi:hypothetical protein